MRNGRLHVTLTLPLTLPFLWKCNLRKSFAEVFHVCGRVCGTVGPAPPPAQEPVRAACQGRRAGCGALLAGPDRRHADRYQHRRAKRAARCMAAVRARSAPPPKGFAARPGAERADRPPQPAAFTGQHADHLGGHGLCPAGNAARAAPDGNAGRASRAAPGRWLPRSACPHRCVLCDPCGPCGPAGSRHRSRMHAASAPRTRPSGKAACPWSHAPALRGCRRSDGRSCRPAPPPPPPVPPPVLWPLAPGPSAPRRCRRCPCAITGAAHDSHERSRPLVGACGACLRRCLCPSAGEPAVGGGGEGVRFGPALGG
jgi:hypothetical protein